MGIELLMLHLGSDISISMFCDGSSLVVVAAKKILAGNGPTLLRIWSTNWKSVPMNILIMDLLLYIYCRNCPDNSAVDIAASRKKTTVQQPELATF